MYFIAKDPEGIQIGESRWEVARKSREGLAGAGFSQHIEGSFAFIPHPVARWAKVMP